MLPRKSFSLATFRYCKRKWSSTYRWHMTNVMFSNVYVQLLLLCLTLGFCRSQQQTFPPIINGARNKPISTSPEVGTCGYNTAGQLQRSAFCRSSSRQESVTSCSVSSLGHCNQECPQRTHTPMPSVLLTIIRGSCISPDRLNIRPGAQPGSQSLFFQNGPDCYSSPDIPVIGNLGELSIAVWIRPDVSSDSTLIERRTQSDGLVYAVMVSSSAISFDYMTASGARVLTTQGGLQTGQWQHMAIQIFDSRISFFINGVEQDGTPFETQDLTGRIVDQSNSQNRVGQRLSGATQFVGRLQDFFVYSQTLTNREIQELATGVFPEVHAQSECRCPDSHPRINPNPVNSRFCIRNGDPDTTSDFLPRLNEFAHPLTFANDGDLNTYWVSAFTDDLIVDIDLENGQYQVLFVVLQFYSPQPTAVSVYRKMNDSSDWEPWQYFAEDCSVFGLPNNGPLQSPSAVNCLQFNSNPPYSNGNITFMSLAPEPVARPGYDDFYNTPDLLEFVLATQVRIRMQGHYYVTAPRHGYYGIEDITVNTRCNCNGHASSCDTEADPYQCNCLPESFTQGRKCEECLPLYNNKPYRRGDTDNAYNCKACQCYGHASSCVYDSSVDPYPGEHERGGGGVCVDCLHNTQGQYCDECQTGFYWDLIKSLDAVDVCSPCQCETNGTIGGSSMCNATGGQCECKSFVTGLSCDRCEYGFYNLRSDNPNGCEQCRCDLAGSTIDDCDQASGECDCKSNVIGERCERCNFGFYNLTSINPLGCQPCSCDPEGSLSPYCDPDSGQCQCKGSTEGPICDLCRGGFYGLGADGCQTCDCDTAGTLPGTACNRLTGQCVCKANTMGRRCDQCSVNSYNLQASNQAGCSSCSCTQAGTINGSMSCDSRTGQCLCKANVVGRNCNQCAPDTYGLSGDERDGCAACDCEPSGTVSGAQSCDQTTGQCPCLSFREGRQCDACSLGYFISPSGQGCQWCGCDPAGTQNGTVCDPVSGQCQCHDDDSGVTGRQCDECLPGYFNFDPDFEGCESCDCDLRGSTNMTCHPQSGQCSCKELVTGRGCDSCQLGSSNLQAGNPQGCSKEPKQQPPPSLLPVSPFAVLLTWGPPDQPNGVITEYAVLRNGTRVTRGLFGDVWNGIQQFQDSSLMPYTPYSYVIEASNQAGSTQSPPAVIRTLDAIPADFDVLSVSNVQARTADFAWFKPPDISAPIVNYILTSITPSQSSLPTRHYSGLDTQYQATDLIPFTNYTFHLTVCTEGSCGQGLPVYGYTESAPPDGLVPPNITAINETSVFIRWDHPLAANGIITHYELFIRGLPDALGVRDPPQTRIFYPAGWYNPRPVVSPREEPAQPPATEYTYHRVTAYTLYEFMVTARNQAGTGQSVWVLFRSMEAEPLFMPAPSAEGLSSEVLNVSWPMPADNEVRGQVIGYTLFQVIMSSDPFAPPEVNQQIDTNDGSVRHSTVTSLLPYQEYTFVVEVCNSLGCVTSDRGTGRTLAAAPEGQVSPLVDGYNATSMLVSWSAPLSPNGPDPEYTLERTQVALSSPPPRVERGARFIGSGFYRFPGSLLPVSSYTGIDLEFRVMRPEGSPPVDALILFAASPGNQEEYVVIQLRAGRPWFLFDPQGGAVGVTPADGGLTYDDGMWHRIRVNRIRTLGSIVVDETYTGTATAPTSNEIIGQSTGIYIGGLPSDFVLRRTDLGILAVVRSGFAGCLRNVRLERSRTPVSVWEDLSFASAEVQQGVVSSWQGCPTDLQSGVHFPGRGYVMLPAGVFSGGDTFSMSLAMRTENLAGTLLLAHGDNGELMVLELVAGNLQLTINTGSAPITITIPGDQLCDGQWEEVAIDKAGPLVTLSVVSSNVAPQSAILSSAGLELTSPLYVGGIPEDRGVTAFAGVDVQAFGGCMEDLAIDDALIDLSSGESSNVFLDGCPGVPGMTCTSPLVTEEYRGDERIVYSPQLEVFTEYMYRVTASNSIGTTSSRWSVGRTREGVPTGVSAPIDPMSLDGYTIHASWQRPAGNTGVLTQYVLAAYNSDVPLLPPVEAVFSDTSLEEFSENITGVIPFTNYLVSLRACTAGGCSESGRVPVFTLEEAPDGVQPPIASEVGGRYLDLIWPVPASPNGIITLYQLIMNGATIYQGGQQNHSQAGLSVFTGYRFILTACTRVGCSDSPEVTIATSQLPPESIAPPNLFVQGPTSIEAQWTAPGQVNGILERYVILLSESSQSPGLPVYNTSDLFTDYVLRDLTPGTLYYVAVMACTGGGCSTSVPSSAQTSESAPSGVQTPTVVAASATQLDVFWRTPDQPNGLIISYGLIHNNVPILNSTRTSTSITALTPWSLHTFRLEACTLAGCAYSPEVQARTLEAIPVGTINLAVSTTGPRTVDVIWSSPVQPNGQLLYEVLFEGLFYTAPDINDYSTVDETRVLLNTSSSNQMFVIGGLIPNTGYTIRVRATNNAGSLSSDQRTVTMPPGSPDGVLPPALTPNGPTSILASWADPARNNAPGVASFLLTFRPANNPGAQQELFSNPTRATSFVKSGLDAYQEYEFRLTAVNNFGQTRSAWVTVFTLESVPGPVDPPMATIIDAYTLHVTWEAPDRPNGVITSINLYQNDNLRTILPGNVTSFTADSLVPFSEYTFKIEVCNSQGCSISPPSTTYTTPQATPSGQEPPTLMSDTPTSVIVTWRPPASPNGALIGYEIERRLMGYSAVFTVVSVSAGAPRSYRDSSPSITPYTGYEYRVRVSSSAGSFASLWAGVTTLSAAPGGLRPPVVDVLGSTSIRVTWEPPAEANGIILSYTIRMPQPVFYLDNITATTEAVDSLTPYTDYEVTIEACTLGGCTESDSTPARTQPAPPQGQGPPRADPITQTYMSVIWSPPTHPNGPGIRYGLQRQKIRQPLETGIVFGVGFWELIYNGTQTSFQDRGLTTFTTYVYRITTFNQIGLTTSPVSEEMTTLAGYPTVSGTLSAWALDHVSVLLDWTIPSLLELQGAVVQYYIRVNSTADTRTLSYPPGTNSTTLLSLQPNTLYELHLLISNGAYNISSDAVTVETLDGAPEGFDPPLVQVLSASSVQVMWREPMQPNGDITSYHVLLDESQIGQVPQSRLSFVVSRLQPYTIYAVRIEVCTVFDCLVSNATIFTTLEVTPSGISPPALRALGSTAVEIVWTPPTQPNGIVLEYELLRRELRTCSDSTGPDNSNTCGYVECGTTESVCGGQCFSGSKVCCHGQVHEYQPDYQCCSTNYLPVPTTSTGSYSCCGGQFHTNLPNYQCCKGQYISVQTGHICCADPTEDRVVVGTGDSCCAGVPYDSSGPQICCAGTFNDGFNSRCCGSSVILMDQVCCEEKEEGRAHQPTAGYTCCGLDYVDPDLTLCCSAGSGYSRVHYYLSEEDKQFSRDQCCGLDKILPSDSCCNGIGYNPSTHVCADRGSIGVGGCGMGVVCPVNLARSAYCNRCDFDTNTRVCAAVESRFVGASNAPPIPSNVVTLCPTALTTVASTSSNTYSYLDLDLSPYTTYQYAIAVHNSAGSATSPLTNTTTHEARPSGVLPPSWSVPPGVLDRIVLAWNPPTSPNGVIMTYILQRDGIEIFRGMAVTFTDRNGIQPYQQYTYILQACTVVGCASSTEVVAATLESVPEGFADPVVITIDAYSIQISWLPPSTPNGIIRDYVVLQMGVDEPLYTGDGFVFIHQELVPFTSYEYRVEACTAGGCATTNPVSASTAEAAPQGVSRPTHVVFSASVVEIYWTPPTTPNGILTGYRLFRDGIVVYIGGNATLMFLDEGLSPNTRYQYVVEVSTAAGATNSTFSAVHLPVSAPQGIPLPELEVISSTSISATWAEPTMPNGDIVQYGLILMSGTANQREVLADGMNMTLLIEELTPYTLYDIRVLVCNDGGCGVGPREYARTLEAPPEGQFPPLLTASGPSVVVITWDPPTLPNGVIISYAVYRRLHGTTQELLVCLKGGLEYDCINAGEGLQPFTLYEYRVRATNNEGNTDSLWASVRTLEAPPVGVAQPVVVAVDSFAAHVTWSPPQRPNGLVLGYRIEHQEISNNPTGVNPIIIAATVESNTFDTRFYGLAPFTPYNVRIVAFNSAGEAPSPWAIVETAEGVPADIGLFDVEQNSDGLSMFLRWDVPGLPNGEIREYRIYEDVYLITPIYIGMTREYLFRRLTPYTEYSLVLEACTRAGCGRGDPQTVITAEVLPANQPEPTIGLVDATSIQLIWKPPIDPNGVISSYEVIRRSTTQTTRRKRDTDDSSFTETQVIHTEYNTDDESFEYTDRSLRPFRLYEYRIRVVNSRGSTHSDWVAVQTTQAPPTGVLPPTISIVPNAPDSVVVSWLPPGEANGVIQGYRLQRNGSAPFSFNADDQLSYMDTGLEPFTVYGYTVTVCSGGGCTTSPVTTVLTLESAPEFVDPPVPSAISSRDITVTWVRPSIDTGDIVNLQLKVDGVVTFHNLLDTVTVPDLIPFQEYAFVLVACTSGGCTESLPAYERPFPAAPEGIAPPVLRALDSRRVEVTWSEPEFPNGDNLRYELRRDGKLVYDGSAMRWQDFGDEGRGLTPGQEYSYVITAVNSEGRAISDPARVVTSADTPAGLSPPTLTSRSALIITTQWQDPLFPNGRIQNFTLFLDGRKIFSGLTYNFDVKNLAPFTEYEFYVEACTQQGCAASEKVAATTLESAPQGQLKPTLAPLADNFGVASGIMAEWSPPTRPNGVIIGYQLFRRRVFRPSGFRSEPVNVHNGTSSSTQYRDVDGDLVPDESYEYMVISRNGAGQATSQWAVTRMLEAPPQGMLPPEITDISAESLTVNVRLPTQPNGRITHFFIYRNETEIVEIERTVFEDTGLEPFTYYSYAVQACTGGGCSMSDYTTVLTLQNHPTGLEPPRITAVGSTWIYLEWDFPTDTNGIISQFELLERPSCPLAVQPFDQPCKEQEFKSINKDLILNHNMTGLTPYTRYDFLVKASNARGFAESSVVSQITSTSAPQYSAANKPFITTNLTGEVVRIDWTGSFILNGQLREYILEENGDKVFSGIATADTRPLKNGEYEFIITVVTNGGQESSPAFIYSPGTVAAPLTVIWYQSVWFIAIIILIGIVIIFILIGLALSKVTPSRPYERERQPLPPRQRRAHNFTFASSFKYPDDESIMTFQDDYDMDSLGWKDPIPKSISQASSMHSLHNPFSNQVSFPPPYPNSRPSSRTSGDKVPLKYLADDHEDGGWGENPSPIPQKPDSGMVSMADYDDDQMTNVSQTYSYTKEQTMFTDTHL